MKLYVIKSGKKYLRFTEGNIICADMSKASVFADLSEAKKQLQIAAEFCANPRIYVLEIYESMLQGV